MSSPNVYGRVRRRKLGIFSSCSSSKEFAPQNIQCRCNVSQAGCMQTRCSIVLILTFCLWSSSGIQIYTAIQTRKFAHQDWTPVENRTIDADSSTRQFGNKDYVLPPLELRDEPQNTEPYHPPRRPDNPFERSTNPFTKPNSNFNHQYSASLQSTNRVNSYPPWYADKYKRYPRDEADPSPNGILPHPWNYQPRCRSCGRPLLQDSFCSDDFVIRVFVYKDISTNNGEQQYLVYVYDVYKDTKKLFQSTHYSRITYRCDRFQTGPQLGQVYLLTGLYENGVPNVDSCSWKAKWNDVTKQQKRYLRFKYQAYCGICKIQRVLRINPVSHRRSDTCYVALTPNPNELACRDRFSICRYRRHKQSCGFNKRTPYNICEKWLSVKA